jgi:hypothetical protein
MPTRAYEELPIAAARYGKTVILQYDNANDAKALFRSLCPEAEYYPPVPSFDFLRNVANWRFPKKKSDEAWRLDRDSGKKPP